MQGDDSATAFEIFDHDGPEAVITYLQQFEPVNEISSTPPWGDDDHLTRTLKKMGDGVPFEEWRFPVEQEKKESAMSATMKAQANMEIERHRRAIEAGGHLADERVGKEITVQEVIQHIASNADVTERDAQLATFELIDSGRFTIDADFSLRSDPGVGGADDEITF